MPEESEESLETNLVYSKGTSQTPEKYVQLRNQPFVALIEQSSQDRGVTLPRIRVRHRRAGSLALSYHTPGPV